MNKFLKEFKDRGYFYQCTDENELSDLLNKKKIKPTLVLIVQLKVYMLAVYYKLCVYECFKNMGTNQLYY